MKAFDGNSVSSSATAYKVNVDAINQAPALTNVTKLYTNAPRNNYYSRSFEQLAADLLVTDAEDIDPNNINYSLIKLRIELGTAGTEIRVGT